MGEALMIVAGIGCRLGATAEEVNAALTAAMVVAGQVSRPTSQQALTLSRIATAAAKGEEPGIKAAAARRGIPLVLISQVDLEANSLKTLTRSSHSMQAMNVHSVAEAAALAAAGQGSRLLGPRIAVGPVTCALAVAFDAGQSGELQSP
jgi:cobalt-precorrin 5A hydrolase